MTNLIRSRRAQALTPPLHSQLEGVKWRVAPLRLAMRGWDVSSTADCGRQRWAMGDERSYLDLHSFPRPLRTELRTNRHACALAVMISLRGAMPLEGAVLPQPEAEPAVLGLARPHRLPHASASSDPNVVHHPWSSTPIHRSRDWLSFFLCLDATHCTSFFSLLWPSGGMCSGFSASVLGQSVTFARAYLGR